MFKINNRSTKRRSGAFIVNFKYIGTFCWAFFDDFKYVNGERNILLS